MPTLPAAETQPPRRFKYKRRTPKQWRRNARKAGGLSKGEVAWLVKLLNSADRSLILGDWELRFTADLDQRLAEFGARLVLSDRQRQCLERIERRLIKAAR
jgi:hypothetical protein